MSKIMSVFKIFLIIFSSIWVCLFIWVQEPYNFFVTLILILLWISLATFCIYPQKYKYLRFFYSVLTITIFVIFFSLTPQNDRDWDPEVKRIASYRFIDHQIEIQNIRNFIWKNPQEYITQWDTRRYDIEKIQSMDLVLSYFMKGPVAHAFVTFGFEDGQHLSFSLEVRKEMHESFSVIGGFFRQYELALVVGDENDLIYTRSNIRGEKVYIYPINMQKSEIQKLFLIYLDKADQLSQHPRWYNTLISNCTTIIFDLVERVLGTGSVPRDYRVLLPGLLPEYLYDKNQLDRKYTLEQWQKMAFVNSKTDQLKEDPDQTRIDFSKLIREGLPAKKQVPSS